MKKWTEESVPDSIQVVKSSTTSPDKRAERLEVLLDQARSNASLVDGLIEEVESLIGLFDSASGYNYYGHTPFLSLFP